MIKKVIFTISILFLSTQIYSDGLGNIPLHDPVYPFLEKSYAYGYIEYISQVRPYTEEQVFDYLQDIESYIIDNKLEPHSVFVQQLGFFKKRYTRKRDTFVTASIGDDSVLMLQPEFAFQADSHINTPGDTIPFISGNIEMSASFGSSFFLSMKMDTMFNYWGWTDRPYKPFQSAHVPDKHVFSYSLDDGSSSFDHKGNHTAGSRELVVTTNMESQLSVDLKYLTLGYNKGSLDIGPSSYANLAMSKDAKPFEYFGFNLPFGKRGMFSWFTGFLYDPVYSAKGLNRRLLAHHRIEYQITDWFLFAIYESVIYNYSFEMAYLNPFSIYYIAEVNQGTETTNKLGGLDFIFRLPKSKVYLSMFVDDWDMKDIFSFNASHNEWIGTLGVRYFDMIPGLDMLFEYTYSSHWMYTHFSDNVTEMSSKSYQHYRSPLGHFLPPNAHMAHLQADYAVDFFLKTGTSFSFIQNGRGDINSPPDWASENALHGVTNYRDIYYSFLDMGKPGFAVQTLLDWGLFGSLFLPDFNLTIRGRYSLVYSFINKTEDWALVDGSTKLDHYVSLDISWLP